MAWPKNLERPGYYANKLEGICSSLIEVGAKVTAAKNKILADKFMDDDEKAARLIAQEKRWQKVLDKAKKLLAPVGDYLVELRKAEERAREPRQPELGNTKAWQEAAARGNFVKADVDALAGSADFKGIIKMYRQAEAEGDDVGAWLVQRHGLIATEVSAEAKSGLVTAIVELHPPDPDVLEAIEEARASLAPAYSEIQGEMGFGDEHEIRVAFGLERSPSI